MPLRFIRFWRLYLLVLPTCPCCAAFLAGGSVLRGGFTVVDQHSTSDMAGTATPALYCVMKWAAGKSAFAAFKQQAVFSFVPTVWTQALSLAPRAEATHHLTVQSGRPAPLIAHFRSIFYWTDTYSFLVFFLSSRRRSFSTIYYVLYSPPGPTAASLTGDGFFLVSA